LSILRAIGTGGRLYSYERRADFAKIAMSKRGDVLRAAASGMGRTGGRPRREHRSRARRPRHPRHARPWECIDAVGEVLEPGACCAATSPPPPSSGARWTRCASTAAGWSRGAWRCPYGSGMPKASRSGRLMAVPVTRDSSSTHGVWPGRDRASQEAASFSWRVRSGLSRPPACGHLHRLDHVLVVSGSLLILVLASL